MTRWRQRGEEHQSIGLFLSRAANGNQISRSWLDVIQRRCIIVTIYSSRVINATACKRAARCQWLPIDRRAIYAIAVSTVENARSQYARYSLLIFLPSVRNYSRAGRANVSAFFASLFANLRQLFGDFLRVSFVFLFEESVRP